MATEIPDLPIPSAIYPIFADYKDKAHDALAKGYFTDSVIARYIGVAPKHIRWWRRISMVNPHAGTDLQEFFEELNTKQADYAAQAQQVHIKTANSSEDPDKQGRVYARYFPELRDEASDVVDHGIPTTRIEEEYKRAGVAPQERNEGDNEQSRGGGDRALQYNTPALRGPAYSAKAFAKKFYPSYCAIEFAFWHSELLEWATALQYNVPPTEHLTAIVNRDGGKSTLAEIIMAFVMSSGRRGYGLYLCGTQRQANDHVTNISGLLQDKKLNEEFEGVGDVALDKNNRSLGWKTTRITSKAGFTIDAIGIDTQIRGAKMDEKRVDFIIMDDIDNDSDTPYRVETKIEALGRKILPAGSGNLAVLAVQNLITSYSVFARIKNNNTDVLKSRVIGPVPAVYDLKTDPPDPLNTYAPDGVKITGGKPSWEGFTMAKAQNVIELVGIRNFLAEYQHETDVMGGLAFASHWKKQYVEVELENNPPDGYIIRRSYDYGSAKPFAVLWYAEADGVSEIMINGEFRVVPKGSILVMEEEYGWIGTPNQGDNTSSGDHADRILDTEASLPYRNRIKPGPADASIYNVPDNGEPISDIHAAKGVYWVPSDKSPGSRQAGAELFRKMLTNSQAFIQGHLNGEEGNEDNACFFVSKHCENTIRTIPNLPMDSRTGKDGDVDTKSEDHLWDALRYAIMSGNYIIEGKVIRE